MAAAAMEEGDRMAAMEEWDRTAAVAMEKLVGKVLNVSHVLLARG